MDSSRAPPLPAPIPLAPAPPPPPLPPLPPPPIQQSIEQPAEHNDRSFTLLVKHLPDALPLDTLKRLFSHYGASDIRPCVAGRMKSCAFVDFNDESQAVRAQSQLHRLRFLGKILSVERAKPHPGRVGSYKRDDAKDANATENDVSPPLPPYPHPQGGQQLLSSIGVVETKIAQAGHKNESIAPSLGVDYVFPPHLEYAYPPPDGNILTNIVNALIAVPRFYTQVLHLMNKMNLPAPFRPALPTPPLPPPPPAPADIKPQVEDLSSDESELESSEETGTDGFGEPGETGETRKGPIQQVPRKRARSNTVVGSSTEKSIHDKVLVNEAVGAKPTPLVPKEKPIIRKKQPVLQINITSKGLQREQMPDKVGTGLEKAEESLKEEVVAPRNSVTREELEAGRMPLSEILALPMFKNYSRGTPTSVLYVKNLAKDVDQEDLCFVFGAVFPRSEDFKSQLGIKLMQEGRMRGQAFVTFPSTDLAQDALNSVHGFVLKGKPMIVQFGRNPTAAKTILD